MKKLELEQFGVSEMSSTEIINVNGGSVLWWAEVIEAVSDYLQGMDNGYKWASKHLK